MTNFEDKIEAAMIRGVQDAGELMFRRSQQYCPVSTGNLKRSGFVKKLPDGVTFGYTAKYAHDVEFGHQKRFKAVPPVYVKPFRRRLRAYNDAVVIYNRAGDKHARKKWQDVRGYYRRAYFKMENVRNGNFFMSRAIEEYRPQLGKIILMRLQQAFA